METELVELLSLIEHDACNQMSAPVARLRRIADYARKAIAAIDESRSVSGWRDIAEAPKDGSFFLAWCPRVGLLVMRKEGAFSETWPLIPGRSHNPEPTHFQPLPAPPGDIE